jgi:hypothetical protein
MSYTTKAKLLSLARVGTPGLSGDVVTDDVVEQACDRVDSQLAVSSFFSSIDAGAVSYKFLQRAAENFGLEWLCMNGKVRWTTGDVQTIMEGNFKVDFQKWMPMFFFAQGDSARFNNLLPHETFRMMATKYVDAFIKAHAQANGRRTVAIFHDDYRRGYKREDTWEHWR